MIILTGSSGFVGTNLKSYLKDKSQDINCLSLREDDWKNKLDKSATAIVHLAGKAHDTSNTSDSFEYFKINRDLTIEIFREFLNSEIRDFFYFSSVKAVADTVDGILNENEDGNPKTPYGKSKLEAEKYLLSQELGEGKRLFIIRPCMIHGPGNKGNLNLLFNMVKQGFPWPLGAFDNKRSFLCINNLNYLIYQMIMNCNVKSGIYNFSDDGSLSTNELYILISDVLSKKSKIWKINKNIIEFIAKIGDKVVLPLNSERLKKLTESYIVSNKKIKDALAIDILPTSIDDGLKITIESFNSKPK